MDVYDEIKEYAIVARTLSDALPDTYAITTCQFVQNAFADAKPGCDDTMKSIKILLSMPLYSISFFSMWVILIVVLSRLLNKDRLIDSETTVDESTTEKKRVWRGRHLKETKRNFIMKSERYLNRHQVHTVVIYFYKVDTHTRHYKREIACSVVLRAPLRRTSPNLQRPFLLGFFTFPSFASFVCLKNFFFALKNLSSV